MNSSAENLIWIDLEMTGLNPDSDKIIEVATVVTDKNLDIITEGPVLAVYQPDSVLQDMDEWNTKQHGQSGLVERVRQSDVDELRAQTLTLKFLRRHIAPRISPMCGNSICQDRRFLAQWMPELEAYFHYRNLDVSSLKELAKRWKPEVASSFKKQSRHLALEDIKDSINELKHYRRYLLQL